METRAAPPADSPIPLLPGAGLRAGRAHELCGPARHTLAAALAGRMQGPVVWIAPAWASETLCGGALAEWADPGRLILVRPQRLPDLLWCAEEALRSRAAPLVVADLPDPPGLTAVRRLHLAAEGAGALMALLCPGEGGAAGVETRWHMRPAHAARHSRWQIERRRARMAPPARWQITTERDLPAGRYRLRPCSAAPEPGRSGPDQIGGALPDTAEPTAPPPCPTPPGPALPGPSLPQRSLPPADPAGSGLHAGALACPPGPG